VGSGVISVVIIVVVLFSFQFIIRITIHSSTSNNINLNIYNQTYHLKGHLDKLSTKYCKEKTICFLKCVYLEAK
jgi:hypothetical protein